MHGKIDMDRYIGEHLSELVFKKTLYIKEVINMSAFGGQNMTKEERLAAAAKGAKTRSETAKKRKSQRELLRTALDMSIAGVPALQKLAKQLGVDGYCSLQELMTVKLVVNTLKDGKIKDLESVVNLLGEKQTGGQYGVLGDVLEFMKEIKGADSNGE